MALVGSGDGSGWLHAPKTIDNAAARLMTVTLALVVVLFIAIVLLYSTPLNESAISGAGVHFSSTAPP
jgi:hypothetical protein